jgi:capsular exopolysaccharide synthesis family protein
MQDEHSRHLFAESIDITRTLLLEVARAESDPRSDDARLIPQIVLITSAQAGEGKTSLATHLAASLAQIGHKTLLIDADLRNPAAHRIVGLSRTPGCCELLRDEVNLADVVHPTPVNGLWMIPGGRWDSRATRALAQPKTAEILKKLRGNFEFILIDSPPVLPVVDPLLIGRHVDIVLLSVLRHVSRMKNVYAACQRLTMAGAPAIRGVMSGVGGEDYDSSYQYLSKVDLDV